MMRLPHNHFLSVVDVYARGRVIYWLTLQVVVDAVAIVVGGNDVNASHYFNDVSECVPLVGSPFSSSSPLKMLSWYSFASIKP